MRRYSLAMAIRPTSTWRENSTWRSESLLARIDETLQTFETNLAALSDPSDEQIFRVIETVIVSLNRHHFDDGADFGTIDREELCDYVDQALTEAGIDVDALAERRGIDPAAITDQWRDW
jgi:hypothetical protein